VVCDVVCEVRDRDVLVVEYTSDAPRAGVDGDAASVCGLLVVVCDVANCASLPVEEGSDPSQCVLALLDFDESFVKSVMVSCVL
jgi:hypothetical protein